MLTDERRQQFALLLREAELKINPISPLSELDNLEEADAYEIQKINIDAKCAQGMKIVGKKIGLTSKPMQEMFGVDSRIKDWQIKIVDTISDNASSGGYILSSKHINPKITDIGNIKMQLFKNDILVNEGMGSAALGHPANCVAWLANKMSAYGVSLKKGEVILSGALSAAVPAVKGDYFRAEFTELGSVEAKFI